jgi:hypothetical protein
LLREGRLREGGGGARRAGDRVGGRQAAQVGEREERLRAYGDGQIQLELGHRVMSEHALERREGVVDQAEADAGTRLRGARDGHRARDHRAHRALVGMHAAQQVLRRESHPLGRVAGGGDRGERLLRFRPHAGEGLLQQRDQVGEVPVRGRL